MTIKQLIEKLEQYENQDANVTVEVADNGDNARDCEWELFSDTSDMGYVTIGVEL